MYLPRLAALRLRSQTLALDCILALVARLLTLLNIWLLLVVEGADIDMEAVEERVDTEQDFYYLIRMFTALQLAQVALAL